MPAHRNDEKADAMYALYQDGHSLARVAKAFGITRQGVYKMFARRGLMCRRRVDPLPFVLFQGRRYTLRNTGYYGRTTNRRELLHRDVWRSLHGPIPRAHDVHHRDGDKTNNRADNLELISKSIHASSYPGRQNQHTKHPPSKTAGAIRTRRWRARLREGSVPV